MKSTKGEDDISESFKLSASQFPDFSDYGYIIYRANQELLKVNESAINNAIRVNLEVWSPIYILKWNQLYNLAELL